MAPQTLTRFAWQLLLLLVLPSLAHAGVHKCTDEHDRVFYQDRPCADLKTARLPSHLSQLTGQAEQRHFLWKVVSAKGSAYLLGSLHYGSPEMYPMAPPIMEAFAASDVLVVEVDPNSQTDAEVTRKITEAGTYPEDTSLEDQVKPATWQKLVSTAKTLGLPEETLRQQKPWLAILTLSSLLYKQAGLSPEFGIDHNFLKDAGTRKPILALESAEQQIKLFDALPAQEQEQMLLQSLNDFQRGPELINSMLDAWKKGDAEAMDLIVRQSFGSDAISEKLFKRFFTDRNNAMASKLEELMADGRSYFLVVGAGHLGGDTGILKLLEDKGYKVTQP